MKIKEILLDFTPLLDITLILLFFFLLFSNFEMEETRNALAEQAEAVQQQMVAAEDRMDEANSAYERAEALNLQLEEELEIVNNASERQGSNTQALLDFNRGTNIKIILSMENNVGIVKIYRGDEQLASTTVEDDISEVICATLSSAGYSKEDTVLCEFVLNGSEPGTASAYRKIKENLLYVKGTYHYFYYSETDISLWED